MKLYIPIYNSANITSHILTHVSVELTCSVRGLDLRTAVWNNHIRPENHPICMLLCINTCLIWGFILIKCCCCRMKHETVMAELHNSRSVITCRCDPDLMVSVQKPAPSLVFVSHSQLQHQGQRCSAAERARDTRREQRHGERERDYYMLLAHMWHPAHQCSAAVAMETGDVI